MAKWIQRAIKRPGALRRATHTKKGKTIPVAKLQKLSHQKKGGHTTRTARQARLALTLRRLRRRRRRH